MARRARERGGVTPWYLGNAHTRYGQAEGRGRCVDHACVTCRQTWSQLARHCRTGYAPPISAYPSRLNRMSRGVRGGDRFRVWLWDVACRRLAGWVFVILVSGDRCTDKIRRCKKVQCRGSTLSCVCALVHTAPPQVSRAIKRSATHTGPLPASYIFWRGLGKNRVAR